MNPRDFLAKWKTHLLFVSVLLFVLAFNITIGSQQAKPFWAQLGGLSAK